MIEYESLSASNSFIIEEIKEAVCAAIDSGYYILGPSVEEFEKKFSSYTTKYCVGVGNGLNALEIAFSCLDIPRNSEILVASNTYIATILAIINSGFRPVLVEPDINTYNIDPNKIINKISSNTSAICVTHMYGKPCSMKKIKEISESYNLKLIEDCAQSHGAMYENCTTGSFGDAGCFSFYPTKNLGGLGDGGAIVTDNKLIYEKARQLRNYGSDKKYSNRYIGYNSRLDELQAAALNVKLMHLPFIIEHKRAIAEIYFKFIKNNSIILPSRNEDEYDVHHIFPILVGKRNQLKDYLLSKGIKTEIHYPIAPHRQLAMKGLLDGDYPISEYIHNSELSLPISVGTSKEEAIYIAETITNADWL